MRSKWTTFLVGATCLSLVGSIWAAPPPILISEIQAEGGPGLGDAIEIFNPTEEAVELKGWQLAIYDQNDNLSDTIILPEIKLDSNGVLVVSDANGVSNEAILFFPDSSVYWQANEAGACSLLDPDGNGVDFVRWDGSMVTPPGGTAFINTPEVSAMNVGTSLSRDARATDSDRARDWCLRPATLGSQNSDECFNDSIRITEIAAESATNADQVELLNLGRVARNIGNLQLLIYDQNDNLSDTLVLPSLLLQPGGRVVIHDQAGVNSATDLYIDNASIYWEANEPGAVALLNGSVHGIDFVRWDESSVAPPQGTTFTGKMRSSAMNNGTTVSRNPSDRDTDDASDWCLRPRTMGAPNVNECLSDVIRINEISAETFADQIELYNSGSTAHNIGNLQLLIYNENNLISETIILPNFVLPPGGHVVISDQAGTNSATNLYFDGASIIWQANEPGAVALLDGSIHGIDFVRWHNSIVSPPPGSPFTGASNPSGAMTATLTLSRRSDGVDTNSSDDWIIDSSTIGAPNPTLKIAEIINVDLPNKEVTVLISGIELDENCTVFGSENLLSWNEISEFRPVARSATMTSKINGNGKRWFLRATQP